MLSNQDNPMNRKLTTGKGEHISPTVSSYQEIYILASTEGTNENGGPFEYRQTERADAIGRAGLFYSGEVVGSIPAKIWSKSARDLAFQWGGIFFLATTHLFPHISQNPFMCLYMPTQPHPHQAIVKASKALSLSCLQLVPPAFPPPQHFPSPFPVRQAIN
jgi:hypothetical protein